MSTNTRDHQKPYAPAELCELHSGDRMSREEFHRIYDAMPDGFKAELIGGTVYVPSPLRRRHATMHLELGAVFFHYASRTKGLEAGDNATVLLGEESEPQPDLYLRILPEHGGRSRSTGDDYIWGPPELVAEIAHSTCSIDLHAKKDDYTKHGVCEYVVVCIREEIVRWFDLENGTEFTPGDDGIVRSVLFPGLWIETRALFEKNAARLIGTLEAGLATAGYREFVRKLAVT